MKQLISKNPLRYGVAFLGSIALASACVHSEEADHQTDLSPAEIDYSTSYYSGVSAQLEQFGSAAAYAAYVERVRQRPPAYWYRYRADLKEGFWKQEADELPYEPDFDCPVYDPNDPNCAEPNDRIVVTGSRIAAAPPAPSIATSMTNNQVNAVDEGGVVKRIGNRLIILRDGRLFVLNIGEQVAEQPRLESRFDLYDSSSEGTWFDELLVSDNRIVVIGYSYQYRASSYSVYSMDEEGGVEPVGRFLIRSRDYFDGTSYAGRMIGDSIVFEMPISLRQFGPGQGGGPAFFKPDADGDGHPDAYFPLINPAEIYRPVMDVQSPSVQALVKCELEALVLEGPDEACSSVAFVTGWRSGDFYIGQESAYFWAGSQQSLHARPEECRLEQYNVAANAPVYQVDFETMELSVAGTYGQVDSPFWMTEFDFGLSGFVRHAPEGCSNQFSSLRLGLIHLDSDEFSDTYEAVSQDRARTLPDVAGGVSRNVRFIGDALIYAGSSSFWRQTEPHNFTSGVVVVDLSGDEPDRVLSVGHAVRRIEAAADEYGILVGPAAQTDLGVSALDLADVEITSTVRLEDRIEAESRTHAYNATTYEGAGGAGHLIGLASLEPSGDTGGRWWNANPSSAGVSFLKLEDRRLQALGSADPADPEVSSSYSCEVSCVDWYGVVRAFYLNGRAFALTNVELIEVDLLGDDKALMTLNRTRLDAEAG